MGVLDLQIVADDWIETRRPESAREKFKMFLGASVHWLPNEERVSCRGVHMNRSLTRMNGGVLQTQDRDELLYPRAIHLFHAIIQMDVRSIHVQDLLVLAYASVLPMYPKGVRMYRGVIRMQTRR
jgi:hypothetical protein